jgi:hypothetical protein
MGLIKSGEPMGKTGSSVFLFLTRKASPSQMKLNTSQNSVDGKESGVIL